MAAMTKEWNWGKLIVLGLFWLSGIGGPLVAWLAPVTVSAVVREWPDNLQTDHIYVGEGRRGRISREEKLITFRFTGRMNELDRARFEKISQDEGYQRAVDELFKDRSYRLLEVLGWLWPMFITIFEVSLFRRNQIRGRLRLSDHIESGFDIRLIGVFVITSTAISVYLVSSGAFLIRGSDPGIVHSFWRANVDFFLIGAFILTVTACIYAVYAKIVADKVFDATKEIQRAVTGFIGSFSEVMDTSDDSAPSIVRSAQRSLVLYLGNPVAGFFRDEAAGKRFHHAIVETVDNMRESKKFEIKLLCWSSEREEVYLRKNIKKAGQYRALREELIAQIQSIAGGKVYHLPPGADPAFRFIVADGRQAILWVLENPTAEASAYESETRDPKAGGFTTQASNMVRVLEGVFENAIGDSEHVAAAPVQTAAAG